MSKYVLCISDTGYEGDLLIRKVYEVLPDETAEQHNMIRVIDETGEDYLYSADRFVSIDVPEQAQAIFTMETA